MIKKWRVFKCFVVTAQTHEMECVCLFVCECVLLSKTPCVPLETRAVMMWTSSAGNRNLLLLLMCLLSPVLLHFVTYFLVWGLILVHLLHVLFLHFCQDVYLKAPVPNLICRLWHMFCPWHAPVWLRAYATHLYGYAVAAALFSPCHSGLRGHRLRRRGLQKAALPLGSGGAGRGDRVLRWVWSEWDD